MKHYQSSKPLLMDDWLKYHPYSQPSKTDYYYLKLCNNLLRANSDEPLLNLLKWSEYKELTCTLVCWFEDIVSETNIWRSFTAEHKRLYGKYLPFFDTENDYFDDEINQQDIEFLIWHFFSMCEADLLIDPFHDIFKKFAVKTFEILSNEYETAPSNVIFKEKLRVPTYREFFETRSIIEFLAINSYLNRQSAITFLQNKVDELNKSKLEPEKVNVARYDILIGCMMDNVSPFLSMRANEHLANIIGEDHPKYHLIKNISKRYLITCTVKSVTTNHLCLEHNATGQQINLAIDTISDTNKNTAEIMKVGKELTASMVKWGDEWALMGAIIAYQGKPNKEIKDEKHIFDPLEQKLEFLIQHEECFKEIADGAIIRYLENSAQYVELSKQFIRRLYEKAHPDKKFPEKNFDNYNFIDKEYYNCVVFFNRKAGIEIYPGLNNCVKDPRNPYYIQGECADIQFLITDKTISVQFVEYLIDNALIDFDQNKGMDDKTIKDELDFLMRYFKLKNYHTIPNITIVQ